ncbi:DUF5615 family PIN-like protein [Aeoliella sp. ICT_H6.2]|uniref:DUF5615 family PIN-like protein n=1 Tax=Aeoliella straminimaris TaxID=2954799 RepID=A0A9X2JFZ6_9BACT|nr:DUF5615 family PIN-like protein [Aeoliella straminimaris]MCO6044560.1 DUF5615 family PIN-like protein [Aeoliella straminimaris]
MKFLLDENFPKAAVSFLEGLGHTAFEARVLLPRGADDSALIREAQDREAVLLSTDRDFYHALSLSFPAHHGVVVIALKQPNRQGILQRLRWLLESVAPEELANRAFQLRDSTWIARPPLADSEATVEKE